MLTSFSTALSALNAMDTAIDVVGNNLANLNTTGFKTSEVCFQTLVTQSLGADLGETQVGFGVGTPLTVAEFTQGAVQTTDGVLDGAIQGDGFFIVQDPTGQTFYTRAGNFETDKLGNLMTANGSYVQGWMVDPATGKINTNAPVGDIVVPTGSLSAAAATGNISMDLNLNSGAAADSTSDFSQPITVYDSLGDPHTLTLDFQKTDTNQWTYQVSVPGPDRKELEVTERAVAEPGRAPNVDLLLDVDLPVSISFGRTQLALSDVLKMTTGSIVELNSGVNDQVEVLVNRCLVARGEVVVVDGNYGVRILEIVSRRERLRGLR